MYEAHDITLKYMVLQRLHWKIIIKDTTAAVASGKYTQIQTTYRRNRVIKYAF